MNDIILTKAASTDIDLLKSIGTQTFSETFSENNTEENMNKYLANEFSDEKLNEQLSDADTSFFLAKHNGVTVGYLKLNRGKAQTEQKIDSAIEIERIYVLATYHGKKVGQLLLDKAIAEAINSNATYVWLGVWEENQKAIAFYKRNGFVVFDKHLFKLGNDEQTDLMMKRMLV